MLHNGDSYLNVNLPITIYKLHSLVPGIRIITYRIYIVFNFVVVEKVHKIMGINAT